jgi:hypothetical protein
MPLEAAPRGHQVAYEVLRPGPYTDLFDLLENELADFADRVANQPVRVTARRTCALLSGWAAPTSPSWLREHAAELRKRYDPPVLDDQQL